LQFHCNRTIRYYEISPNKLSLIYCPHLKPGRDILLKRASHFASETETDVTPMFCKCAFETHDPWNSKGQCIRCPTQLHIFRESTQFIFPTCHNVSLSILDGSCYRSWSFGAWYNNSAHLTALSCAPDNCFWASTVD